jgi:uncharacterized phage protein (TIGR01671 family)
MKYRIYDGVLKEYRKGWHVGQNGKVQHNVYYQYLEDEEREKCVVELATGLIDNNGVDIYEGDIIEVGDCCINEVDFYCREKGYYKSGDKLVIVRVKPLLEVRDYDDYMAHMKRPVPQFAYNGFILRPRANQYDLWNMQRTVKVIGNIHEKTE